MSRYGHNVNHNTLRRDGVDVTVKTNNVLMSCNNNTLRSDGDTLRRDGVDVTIKTNDVLMSCNENTLQRDVVDVTVFKA